MKRLFLLTLCLASGIAFAQNTETKKFECGANVGVNTLLNYSPVSNFPDNTATYSSVGESIHFGYRKNNTLLAVKVGTTNFSTSAIDKNELTANYRFGLMARRYANINDHFETYIGASLYASLWAATYNGMDYRNTSTWGSNGEVEIGLNYILENGHYFGIRGGLTVGGSKGTPTSSELLPENSSSLSLNLKQFYTGYSLSIQYGIRF